MRIYELEITNCCQFKCKCCPSAWHMTRPQGVITKKIIDRTAEIISYPFISLNHHGESLLFPELTLYATRKFNEIKDMRIEICTNGDMLTPDLAMELFYSGMDKINLSYHNYLSIRHLENIPSELRNKIEVTIVSDKLYIEHCEELLKPIKDMGYSVGIKLLRDFGQIKKDTENPDYLNCSFIKNNEMIVHYNGDICVCCECFNGEPDEILGNVMDKDLPKQNKVIEKCYTCRGYGNSENETEVILL